MEFSIVLIACFLLIIVGLTTFLIRDMSKDRGRGEASPLKQIPAESTGRPRMEWSSWTPYVLGALVLAIWAIWGALFFLAVVWILRQNPKSISEFTPGNKEKRTAGRIYTWLFWSPILTTPVLGFALYQLSSRSPTTNQLVLATLIPLILHTPLLFGLASKSPFVFRHAQQGILFVALRAGLTSLAIILGYDTGDGRWLFLLGNGSLWLFGSIWGWHQVSRGQCWLMERKGKRLVPTGLISDDAQPTDEEFKNILRFPEAKGEDTTKGRALHAFRTGAPEIRKQTVELLSKLGEVEEF